MSSDTQYFLLDLELRGAMQQMAHIRICNGYLEAIHSGYGSFSSELPKGIYTVIISVNESKEELTVVLDKAVHYTHYLPAVYSAIPGSGFRSFDESITHRAEVHSREETFSSEDNSNENNSLFVFFSAFSNNATPLAKSMPSLGKGFSILNRKREKIYTLSRNYSREGSHKEWLAFHTKLPTRIYYISYKEQSGELQRELPLSIFSGWQTQLFLSFDGKPLFSSLRINIVRSGRGFIRESANYFSMEAIIQKAQSGIFYSPFKDLWQLATEKWEEPMKGLLSIYMLLAEGSISSELGLEVINNLATLLGENTPDIKALKIMHAQRFDSRSDVVLNEPCMFLMGIQAAVKGLRSRQFIEASSSTENLLEDLYTDLIWTSCKPKPFKTAKIALKARGNDTLSSYQTEEHFSEAMYERLDTHTDFDNNFSNAIETGEPVKRLGAAERAPRAPAKPKVLNSWVANVILEEMERDFPKRKSSQLLPAKRYSVTELAVSLQLTPSLVNATIDQLLSSKNKIIAWVGAKGSVEEKKYISVENLERLRQIG